jgi:hypothetical protein
MSEVMNGIVGSVGFRLIFIIEKKSGLITVNYELV